MNRIDWTTLILVLSFVAMSMVGAFLYIPMPNNPHPIPQWYASRVAANYNDVYTACSMRDLMNFGNIPWYWFHKHQKMGGQQ